MLVDQKYFVLVGKKRLQWQIEQEGLYSLSQLSFDDHANVKERFPYREDIRVEKETVLQFEALSKKNEELWVLIEKRKWKLQMGNQILSTLSDWQ